MATDATDPAPVLSREEVERLAKTDRDVIVIRGERIVKEAPASDDLRRHAQFGQALQPHEVDHAYATAANKSWRELYWLARELCRTTVVLRAEVERLRAEREGRG